MVFMEKINKVTCHACVTFHFLAALYKIYLLCCCSNGN